MREITIRRPDKVLFPAEGITKADLVDYYKSVADRMLPHLADRPLTLHRFPDGIERGGFYQKEASEYFPSWVPTVEMEKRGGVVHHVVCRDVETLTYLVGQACIVFHTWLSRTDRPRRPDRLIFDLDPPAVWSIRPEGTHVNRLRRAILQLRELLESDLELTCSVMTTGSRGFHVVLPIARRFDFDEVRSFARDVATVLVSRYPAELTLEARRANRGDRIYIDVLRNAYAQTSVAPYSVRALPGGPVAMPIGWDDVSRVWPRQFDLRSAEKRILASADPWGSLAVDKQNLGAARRALAKLLA